MDWHAKSAEQGQLGNMYYDGEGVEQNLAEAVKWFRKAAQQGSAYAQNKLKELGEVW
ncbi:MAG: SEL1-like repeat protein [Synergistaceae bacterium]|nr:SEL1-like repeat protein [Synergistaceae bacterium]